MRPRSRDDFAIAIFCALPLEAEAVEGLFDETYDRLGRYYSKQPGDANAYINGRIGEHDVVLCYMPGMGKGSAAAAASSLLVSYPGVKLALVVGICGGAPLPLDHQEIFLGDVIISDSVIEYDFGKQYPDGFQRKTGVKDELGRPVREIRALLNGLRPENACSELQNKTQQYLNTLQQRGTKWCHPGVDDILFKAQYLHKHYSNASSAWCSCLGSNSPDQICEGALQKECNDLDCDKGQRIRYQEASKAIPVSIHIGPFASADTVMKSGQHRDEIIRKEKVLGFEMEGSGVWDTIPCIIIKGVCNYADGHKGKIWQTYAAASAASCTKSFLNYWLPKTRGKSRHDISSKSPEPLTLPASEFSVSFIHDSIFRDRGVGHEYIGSSGYPASIPYDKAFKKNHIKVIGNTVIRACLIDSLCIRGQLSNIPEGRYEVKWIFCFPDLEYVKILPDDCSAWDRLYALGFLNDRVSYNFHLWLNDKIESALWPYNLSLSVGTAKANSFKYQILNLKRFKSPAAELLHPQFHETKFDPWELARKRSQGWCEMESDQIVEIKEGQNLAFVIWRKYKGQTPGLPGFAFGGIKLCPQSVLPALGQ